MRDLLLSQKDLLNLIRRMSEGSKSAVDPRLVRLGMELGLAVSDYNSGAVDTLDEVVKLTLAYLAVVRKMIQESKGSMPQEIIHELFALVGQSWGSVRGRMKNEYVE